MSLQSLVLCSDQKILRVLRRVLSDLEIGIEHCADTDSAVRKLTRRRFEAVIVDCDGLEKASEVLRSVRFAPGNKRAIAVAIIGGENDVRSAFALGAHFVLHKPLVSERAKSSFRAARALMKVERRRNLRLAIELPVTITCGKHQNRSRTSDVGEGGMAVRLTRRAREAGAMRVWFDLPGTEQTLECEAQVSWESTGPYAGVRFVGMSNEKRAQLRSWLASRSPEFELPDPPMVCRLTDISPGGCYLETAAPFPARTRVALATRGTGLRMQIEGTVRTMHAQAGMAVEFANTTDEQRHQVEAFMQTLVKSKARPLELEAEAEGLDDADSDLNSETTDPLVKLFQRGSELTSEKFHSELRKLRHSPAKAMHAAASA
jgi:DNA-binding response OmpR family regulator